MVELWNCSSAFHALVCQRFPGWSTITFRRSKSSVRHFHCVLPVCDLADEAVEKALRKIGNHKNQVGMQWRRQLRPRIVVSRLRRHYLEVLVVNQATNSVSSRALRPSLVKGGEIRLRMIRYILRTRSNNSRRITFCVRRLRSGIQGVDLHAEGQSILF